jgi:DNA-directed RNA polymerase specialized sigma subunit
MSQPFSFKNIFVNRDDLKSLDQPKNLIEDRLAEPYKAWKSKPQDEDAREQFLEAISPIVDSNISRIPGTDKNQLTIQGKLLAMSAMNRYDPTRGSIATYLDRQLMSLGRESRKQVNVLSIPDRLMTSSQMLDGAEMELEDELGRPPTTTELADKMRISIKQIERLRNLGHERNTGSYSTPEEDEDVHLPGVIQTINPQYRHDFVLSSLANDPISQFIYEHDNGLHGKRKISTEKLASRLKLSPGAISQRRNKISAISNNAEKLIYG